MKAKLRFTLMQGLFWLLLLAWQTGCSVAPLSNGQTARPLGKGQMEFDTILSNYRADTEQARATVPSLRLSFGVTDALDLAIHTEFSSYGLLGKYAILGSPSGKGLSLAPLAGAYRLGNSSLLTAGLALSYLHNNFEPYLIARFNRANIATADFDVKYFPESTAVQGDFGLYTMGFKYWLRRDFALGSEASFSAFSGDLKFTPSEFLVVHTSMTF